MTKSNKASSGRASHLAKLTVSQARTAYRMVVCEGRSQGETARHFKVSQPTIHNLLVGKTYRKALQDLRQGAEN